MFLRQCTITFSLLILFTFSFTATADEFSDEQKINDAVKGGVYKEYYESEHGLDDNWRHWDMGLKAVQLRRFDRALLEFQYYIKHPEMHRHMWGIAYFGRALVFEAKEQYELTINEYKLAIKNDLHPTVKISTKAYMNMGTIYMRENNDKEAIKVYLKAIEINPKNGLAHYFLGLAYFKTGDYEDEKKQAIEAKELGIKYSALSDKLKKVKSSSSKKTKKK